MNQKLWQVAAVVFVGPFMTQLDSTVVNVSLSTMRQELHASITLAQWIISGYLLALALMLPLTGWLVDRIGAKRLYLSCFSIFTLASLLCGAARTIEELIVARLIQGMAGGLLAPMTQMMMARAAGQQMARAMGFMSIPVLIAPIVGPIMAGAVLKYATWPWLFYLNLPVGVLGVGLAALLLPRDQSEFQRRPFDLLGFVLISPGLACLLYGVQQPAHPDGAATLIAGSILSAAFIIHSIRKGSGSLIDIRLFNSGAFSASAATQFMSNGGTYARQFLIPLYLITGCALSPSQTGWMMAVMGIGMMCSFSLMGFLTERFGFRAVSAGGALLALLGTMPFLWMVEYQFSSALTVVSMFVIGVGHGSINIPSISAAYASVPREKLPVATTAINIVQRLGGPLATTLMALVISLSADPKTVGPSSFAMAFAFLIGLQIITLGASNRLPARIQLKHR